MGFIDDDSYVKCDYNDFYAGAFHVEGVLTIEDDADSYPMIEKTLREGVSVRSAMEVSAGLAFPLGVRSPLTENGWSTA